jgi:hypothetical protein
MGAGVAVAEGGEDFVADGAGLGGERVDRIAGPISSRQPPSTAAGASVTSKVAVSIETMPTSGTGVSPAKAVAEFPRLRR